MKLTAVVIGIEAGSQFVDKKDRITLRIMEADDLYQKIRIPRHEDFDCILEEKIILDVRERT
jgi:hypothetical protein